MLPINFPYYWGEIETETEIGSFQPGTLKPFVSHRDNREKINFSHTM